MFKSETEKLAAINGVKRAMAGGRLIGTSWWTCAVGWAARGDRVGPG